MPAWAAYMLALQMALTVHSHAGPHLGAQFAQLVKELRSEYAAAVTACAERIAGALFQRPGYSINASLHRHGVTGTPTIMQQQVRRLEC